MRNLLSTFLCDEDGQDLTEYTLLLAFVAVVSAALLIDITDNMSTIWGITNNNLRSGARFAGAKAQTCCD